MYQILKQESADYLSNMFSKNHSRYINSKNHFLVPQSRIDLFKTTDKYIFDVYYLSNMFSKIHSRYINSKNHFLVPQSRIDLFNLRQQINIYLMFYVNREGPYQGKTKCIPTDLHISPLRIVDMWGTWSWMSREGRTWVGRSSVSLDNMQSCVGIYCRLRVGRWCGNRTALRTGRGELAAPCCCISLHWDKQRSDPLIDWLIDCFKSS